MGRDVSPTFVTRISYLSASHGSGWDGRRLQPAWDAFRWPETKGPPLSGRNQKSLLSFASSLLRPPFYTMLVDPTIVDPSSRPPRSNGATREDLRGKREIARHPARGIRFSPGFWSTPRHLPALLRMNPEPGGGPQQVQGAFVPYSFPRRNEWSRPATLSLIPRIDATDGRMV